MGDLLGNILNSVTSGGAASGALGDILGQVLGGQTSQQATPKPTTTNKTTSISIRFVCAILSQTITRTNEIAITDPANICSQRILQKNGFVLIKQYLNQDGEAALLYQKSI